MHKIAEYEALRATVRERGTVRMCLILAGVIAWGALLLALSAWDFERAATLIPLLVLAATFEISFFIHTGVERVGRYLQVFYETEGPALHGRPSGGPGHPEAPGDQAEWKGWEHTVMAYGRSYPGGPDPLFVTLFAVMAVADFLGSLRAAATHPGWIAVSFLAHVGLAWRLLTARRLSAQQRVLDLERFRSLKKLQLSN